MDYDNLIESFERVRDHAWQTYISTMGESLPVEKVLNSIIGRENRIYDLVYFFGRPKDTTLVIDELLQKFSGYYQNKTVIRMNARDTLRPLGWKSWMRIMIMRAGLRP